jgi:hypothetical protein
MFCHFFVVAEDADECFSEATALRLQQEHTSTSSLEKSVFTNENHFYLPVFFQRVPRLTGS